jgi:hypothetical protein
MYCILVSMPDETSAQPPKQPSPEGAAASDRPLTANRSRSWAVFCAAVLVVVAAIGILWLIGASESFTRCVENANGAARQHHNNSAPKSLPVFDYAIILSRSCIGVFLSDNSAAIAALAAVGLLVVTTSLAIYTYKLWRATADLVRDARSTSDRQIQIMERQQTAMATQAVAAEDQHRRLTTMAYAATATAEVGRDTVRLMTDTAQRQLRAYVSVVPGGFFVLEGLMRGYFEAHNTLVNTGQTPAYDVSVEQGMDMRKYPLPANAGFPVRPTGPADSLTVIGPGQSTGIVAATMEPLPETEVWKIKDGRMYRLYAHGTVRYTDAFGKRHYTNFSHSFVWADEQGVSPAINVGPEHTHEHNDAD